MGSISNPDVTTLDVVEPLVPWSVVSLSIHRYLPIAAFYFFLNHAGVDNLGLPIGVFYTSLLSPLFYIWLYLEGRRWLTANFLLILSPFILAQIVMGIENHVEYLRTLAHWWTVYITVYAFCWALSQCRSLDRLFDQLILLNFCAAMLGLILLPTPLQSLFWKNTETIVGGSNSLRLNLLSTEPSAYAELMFPLLIFAALRLLRDTRRRNGAYSMMIAVPFLLCQSFGGISIGLAAIGVSLMVGYRQLLSSQKSRIRFFCLALATGALLLTPNPISQRVWQAAAGNDPSTQGRTILAYIAGYTVASSKSLWWGVGLGQAKYIDFSYLVGGMNGRIPNMVAGTLSEFGFIGVITILAVEVYLFFRTKVYLNSFRLAIFVVAFLQQFTGSYGTDIQEYLMWFLAFCPLFPYFNLRDDSRLEVSRS
ncbi:MAG: hypothetical protein ABSD13_18040 [Candidatus Korobacteraceae bacterium]|jgi:hypothetical protein